MVEEKDAMWICLVIYATSAIITNLIIHFCDKEEKDKYAVSIASVLWPVTWAICLMLVIERGLKRLWKFCLQKFIHIN